MCYWWHDLKILIQNKCYSIILFINRFDFIMDLNRFVYISLLKYKFSNLKVTRKKTIGFVNTNFFFFFLTARNLQTHVDSVNHIGNSASM